MKQFGNKQSARNLMASVGLPLLPGSLEELDADQALALASTSAIR